jgi:hypothetical protein
MLCFFSLIFSLKNLKLNEREHHTSLHLSILQSKHTIDKKHRSHLTSFRCFDINTKKSDMNSKKMVLAVLARLTQSTHSTQNLSRVPMRKLKTTHKTVTKRAP